MRNARRNHGRAIAGFAIALAAGAGLIQPPKPAMGAVSYRIWTVPVEPRVGELTTIRVATLWAETDPGVARPRPLPMESFPWDFVADSPSGSRHLLTLTRDTSTENEWFGEFTFDEPGEWVIGLDPRHLGTPLDPNAGARVPLVVGGEHSSPVVLVAALLLIAVAGLAIFAKYLSNRTPRDPA